MDIEAPFSAGQALLLRTSQLLFITSQCIIFPLYYLPGLRGRFGGDAVGKFPCSISWMTRKGTPRYAILVLWNTGWAFMMLATVDRALASMAFGDWLKAAFVLQMFAAGFITVVLTPMRGPDVALGSTDALHCYAAMLYVADHVLANELLLGVPLTTAYGASFASATFLCGVCQYLRAEDDYAAKRVYVRCFERPKPLLSFSAFVWLLELGFMVFENALFFIFLFGMCSGLAVV